MLLAPALGQLLAPDVAGKVWHINNGVDCNYFSPAGPYPNPYREDDRVLAFTGAMDYWPNVDAVVWFASLRVSAQRASNHNASESRFR